jgi:hypothetical protein
LSIERSVVAILSAINDTISTKRFHTARPAGIGGYIRIPSSVVAGFCQVIEDPIPTAPGLTIDSTIGIGGVGVGARFIAAFSPSSCIRNPIPAKGHHTIGTAGIGHCIGIGRSVITHLRAIVIEDGIPTKLHQTNGITAISIVLVLVVAFLSKVIVQDGIPAHRQEIHFIASTPEHQEQSKQIDFHRSSPCKLWLLNDDKLDPAVLVLGFFEGGSHLSFDGDERSRLSKAHCF